MLLRVRLGPELETCGYGCEDHFLEEDTEFHSWELIAKLLASDLTDDMLVELGAPVLYEGVCFSAAQAAAARCCFPYSCCLHWCCFFATVAACAVTPGASYAVTPGAAYAVAVFALELCLRESMDSPHA